MEHVWWYVARGSGLLAWGFAAAAVLLGLCMATGLVPAKKYEGWHQWLAGLAVGTVALHLLGLWADSYVTFDAAALFVPLASEWRPTAVAWGIVGFYLLAAVEISSLLRRFLSRRAWRGIHLLSFGLFGAATAHAITAGTDLGVPFIVWTVSGTVLAVAGLLLFRILQSAVPGMRAKVARRRAQQARAAAARTQPATVPVGPPPGGPRPVSRRATW